MDELLAGVVYVVVWLVTWRVVAGAIAWNETAPGSQEPDAEARAFGRWSGFFIGALWPIALPLFAVRGRRLPEWPFVLRVERDARRERRRRELMARSAELERDTGVGA